MRLYAGWAVYSLTIRPAVVALAVPLYDNLATVKRLLVPLLVGCIVGAVIAASSAILIGVAFGLSDELLLTLAPKSVYFSYRNCGS